MADDKQKIKQGQTLTQTAKNPGHPANMAKIIGTAGEGLWDFLQQSYEHLVPQSVEELALEGSPLGKGVSTLAGMIPTKFIKPRIDRLKSIAFGPASELSDEAKNAAEYYINKYPNVMAHVDQITPETDPRYMGRFRQPGSMTPDDYRVATSPEFLTSRVDRDLPVFNWHGLARGTTLSVKNDLRPKDLWETFRHEGGHAAQFAHNPATALHDNTTFPYALRPNEIGARITQNKGNLDRLGITWANGPGNSGLRSQLPNNAEAVVKEINTAIEQFAETPDQDMIDYMVRTINGRWKDAGRQLRVDWPTINGYVQPRVRMEKVVLGR